MNKLNVVKKVLGMFLAASLLISCQAEKESGTALKDLKPMTADEMAIYQVINNLQNYISSSQWDKWLALYTDDAILTSGKKQVSKEEMKSIVGGISYKIDNMRILNQEIGSDMASVSTSMNGNGKKHQETYKMKKVAGKWFIYQETNP